MIVIAARHLGAIAIVKGRDVAHVLLMASYALAMSSSWIGKEANPARARQHAKKPPKNLISPSQWRPLLSYLNQPSSLSSIRATCPSAQERSLSINHLPARQQLHSHSTLLRLGAVTRLQRLMNYLPESPYRHGLFQGQAHLFQSAMCNNIISPSLPRSTGFQEILKTPYPSTTSASPTPR